MHAPTEAQEHLQITAGLLKAPAQTRKTLSQTSGRRTSGWKDLGVRRTQLSGFLLQPGYSHHPEKMVSRSSGDLTHSHRKSTTPQRQQWLKLQEEWA